MTVRLVVFAPHYAEYATRLAFALARHAQVLLIVDRRNRRDECGPDLLRPTRNPRVVEFGSVGRSNRVAALLTILARIALFRPRLILFQEEEGALSAWVARIAGRLRPILLTVHDPRPHSGADAAFLALNARNQRRIRAAARAFHVHGRFCREQLIGQLGEERPIVETAHGVILVPGAGEAAPPEPRRVLMFGRMEAYKGLGVLADAVDGLAARGVAFRLVLAGRGPELSRLSARLAGRPQVEVLERFLSPTEAVREFQRASLVVLPYLDATQSGVVAAAFGNGRPVVASRVGGLVDAVGPEVDGVLVPPGDAVALAAALEALLADPARLARLGAGAARAAAAAFDWAAIADRLLRFASTEMAAGAPARLRPSRRAPSARTRRRR